MNTPTPKTDKKTYELNYAYSGASMRKIKDGEWVLADFARELERDLAAARAEVELIKKQHDFQFDEHHRCKAEVAALREDKARLDWLAKGDTYGKLSSVRLSLPTAFYPTPIAHDCIRAAIDSARKEQP